MLSSNIHNQDKNRNKNTTIDDDDKNNNNENNENEKSEEMKAGSDLSTVDGLAAFQSNPFALLRDGLATFSITESTPRDSRIQHHREEYDESEESDENIMWTSIQHIRYLK